MGAVALLTSSHPKCTVTFTQVLLCQCFKYPGAVRPYCLSACPPVMVIPLLRLTAALQFCAEAQHVHHPAPTALWSQWGLELLQVCAVVFGGWLAIKLKEVSNFFLLLFQTNPVLMHSLTLKTCKRSPIILLCAMWMHQANRKEPPHSHLGKSSAVTHVVQSGLR